MRSPLSHNGVVTGGTDKEEESLTSDGTRAAVPSNAALDAPCNVSCTLSYAVRMSMHVDHERESMYDTSYASYPVVMRIVDRLEADGLDRDSYQLPDVVDPDELAMLVTSGDPTDEITFFLKGRTVTVSGSGDVYVRS